MSQLLSSAVVSAVGLSCKAFLNSGLCSITIINLHVLLDALGRERRESGQGLITVSNHLSTLDDPLAWGILPFKNYTNPSTIRWVLGASDIMFTNPFFSAFFRKGQVIETFRGKGIWQPALDVAIEKLNQGHWLHLFGEGKVHQPSAYPQIHGIAHLPRFKWGVGRIIMEANVPPLIIPMWLTGFDKLMPEHRPFPKKYFPKIGIQLGVTFGEPIPSEEIAVALDALHTLNSSPAHTTESSSQRSAPGFTNSPERHPEIDEVRRDITALVQRAVEDLGRKVSGDKLDLPLSRRA